MTSDLQLLVDASMSQDVHLPQTAPLTLTRNFGWVLLFCLAALVIAPLLIAWIASFLLT